MRAGARVGAKELSEGAIEVGVEEKAGLFVYEET